VQLLWATLEFGLKCTLMVFYRLFVCLFIWKKYFNASRILFWDSVESDLRWRDEAIYIHLVFTILVKSHPRMSFTLYPLGAELLMKHRKYE